MHNAIPIQVRVHANLIMIHKIICITWLQLTSNFRWYSIAETGTFKLLCFCTSSPFNIRFVWALLVLFQTDRCSFQYFVRSSELMTPGDEWHCLLRGQMNAIVTRWLGSNPEFPLFNTGYKTITIPHNNYYRLRLRQQKVLMILTRLWRQGCHIEGEKEQLLI